MTGSRPFESYRSRNTLVNALVGGIVSILIAFIPFSTLVGGFVAGYLHDADRSAAIRVGAFAGLVALVPAVLLGLVIFIVLAGGLAYGAPSASFLLILVLLVGGTISILYTIGASAVGGYLGAIVAEDYAT